MKVKSEMAIRGGRSSSKYKTLSFEFGWREGCDFDPLNLEMVMIYTLFWGSYKRPFTFRW